MIGWLEGLTAELDYTPARARRALRIAAVSAAGAGLMAVAQLGNALGLTLIYNFAAPESAFGLHTAALFVVCAALFQSLGIALAGALVDSPALHFCVFVLICFLSSYAIYASPRLGRLWVWVQIPVLVAFYLFMFTGPAAVGWNDTQAFSGLVIAVALLWLVNSLLWPIPAIAILAESLADRVARSRQRLMQLIELRLQGWEAAPDYPVASKLGHHLELLGPASAEGTDLARIGDLLCAVMTAERIHNEIEQLAGAIARRTSAGTDSEFWRAAGESIDRLLATYEMALRDHRVQFAGLAAEIAAATSIARAAVQRLRAARSSDRADQPLVEALDNLCGLLELDRNELAPTALGKYAARGRFGASTHNRFMIRFSMRHTLAMSIAFVLGLFANSPAMHAALWLLMIGGPPSHGATAKKFTIRTLGAVAALAMAVAGSILLSPNFTGPIAYMAIIFAGTLAAAYVGQGGGVLSYLSIGGTAFVIALNAPGPRVNAVASIWTIWGIGAGMMIRAVVSMVWRERASRTLTEELTGPLEGLLGMIEGEDRELVADGFRRLFTGIREMLAVANDAQLEGRAAGINAANLVDALETLRRIGCVIANRKLNMMEDSGQPAMIGELPALLSHWIAHLQDEQAKAVPSPMPLREMVRAAPLSNLIPSITFDRDSRLADLIDTFARQLTIVSIY